MKSFIFFILIFGFWTQNVLSQPPDRIINYIVNEINDIRAEGCTCGGERFDSVDSIIWSNHLYETAASHAKEMDKYNFFSHFSRKGADIGDRFDELGYNWRFAGENLGEGQDNFDEVLRDWLASPSHCRMIMNVDMKEMGLARKGKYWVQHFGTKMPPNHRRTNRRYSEGN